MEEEPRGVVKDGSHLIPEHGAVFSAAAGAVSDEPRQGARLRNPLAWMRDAVYVELENLPNRLAQVAPGIGVVAHEGDPLRGQMRAAHREYAVAHRLRDPRVDARCDNVIERPEPLGHVHDVEVTQGDVAQTER